MDTRGIKKSDTENIRRVILGWLARRDYSRFELTQKLKSKGYPAEDSARILEELVQTGLINEQRFTENYIYWRRGKGYGPLRISMELQARGIPAEMIAEHLHITDNAWLDHINKVWQKHFKNRLPADYKTRARQIRFLNHRGFTREQIESVFDSDD
ncbi:Regulatory protein RecX [Aquicella siphonis]|uniref:Regulatory protein RecX n=1 Tax=Aquicella siphonis TaxID=254247 RepID=A0A5E4PIL4_9COXI|nr:regulatory protein RecX [Aquicella siphonis]VVC76253.1 Regulatory protein RecX [Aquicella siphonis]